MQPQAPQTYDPNANTANHPVEQLGSREYQQQAIGLELSQLVQKSGELNALLQGLVRIILDQSKCNSLWLGSQSPDGLQVANQGTSFVALIQPDSLWPLVESQMRILTDAALETQTVCQTALNDHANTALIAAPILATSTSSNSEAQLVLTGCFNHADESELRQQWLMSMAAQTISQWQQTRLVSSQSAVNQNLHSALGLVRRLSQTQNNAAAGREMVNYLQTTLHCNQVALSICSDAKSATISAISGVEQVDVRSEFSNQTIAALQQPLLEGRKLEFLIGNEKATAAELALENYCVASGCDAVIALPMSGAAGNSTGSILIGCEKQQFEDPAFHTRCQQIIDLVAGHLQTVLRANDSYLNTTLNRLGRLKKSATARNLMIGAAFVVGGLCVPMPYRVWCDCSVQPVERRFVAAPHEGVLAQSLVRGGDQVAADQVVARLDGRLLRGELAGVQAEFDVAKKRRDLALASGDIAQSQIAKSEMQRHRAKVTILNQRLENLDVRSPIDGVVVVGDLEKAVGVPLELGQTLFEIAPLDTMVAEIGIPESEAQYVEPGMSVQLKFDSFPFQTFSAEIKRVHPRAEAANDASVFIADVVLENSAGRLRPGMSGSAKVSSGWSPLAWNLFHRPWESIRYWTIW